MAFIPKPAFPNVPRLPGVPQLLRSPSFPPNPGPILGTAAALGALWRALFTKSKWGVFKQKPPVAPDESGIETVTVVGESLPVIVPDSILDFGYRSDFDVADYPLQDGAFAAYNKVNLPYEASIRMSKGGSEEDRRKFLQQCEDILRTTTLYQIVTPERTYTDVNPIRFEVTRRGANGAYFLTEVDLYFREIRTVVAQYTNTSTATQNARNPSAQPVDNRGTVAAEQPAQQPAITGVVTQ